jgi:hypothetical protein
VDSPSARSDKIITAVGDCVSGFVILLVDALGGKVKKIVTSAPEGEPSEALVVTEASSWPSFWRLARGLAAPLGVASWEDIDLTRRRVSRMVVLDPSRGSVSTRSCEVPRSVWVRHAGCPIAEAVKGLEGIGCRNVNSSSAIAALSDEEGVRAMLASLGKVCPRKYVGAEPDESVVREVMANGAVHFLARQGRVVLGRGDKAIVSSEGPRHDVMSEEDLREALKNESVSEARGRTVITATRGKDGWSPSSIRCFGRADPERAVEAAMEACLVAQSAAGDGLNELQVDVGEGKEGPAVESVKPVPEEEHDVSEILGGGGKSERKRHLAERELAHWGVYLQPGKKVAVRTPEGLVSLPPDKALEYLWGKARAAVKREIRGLEAERPSPWASMVATRHRHVLRLLGWLLDEMGWLRWRSPKVAAKATQMVKVAADSFGGANWGRGMEDMQGMESRVWLWGEDEEDLTDKPMAPSAQDPKRNPRIQPRYNPEYEDYTQKDKSEYGIYGRWWEMGRNDPYYWDDRLDQSPYPWNKALKP